MQISYHDGRFRNNIRINFKRKELPHSDQRKDFYMMSINLEEAINRTTPQELLTPNRTVKLRNVPWRSTCRRSDQLSLGGWIVAERWLDSSRKAAIRKFWVGHLLGSDWTAVGRFLVMVWGLICNWTAVERLSESSSGLGNCWVVMGQP